MTQGPDHLDGLSDDAKRRLERIFVAFEEAWKRGERPKIADFLPDAPEPERRAARIELVLIDLEYALKADPAARIDR